MGIMPASSWFCPDPRLTHPYKFKMVPEGAMLVTADGDVYQRQEPNEQEAIVAPLVYAQMVAGLGLLRRGGHLVLKLFSAFEPSTLQVLFLLHSLFDSVVLSKPISSKSSTAEVYAVAKGGVGLADVEGLHGLLLLAVSLPADCTLRSGCARFPRYIPGCA